MRFEKKNLYTFTHYFSEKYILATGRTKNLALQDFCTQLAKYKKGIQKDLNEIENVEREIEDIMLNDKDCGLPFEK